MNNTSTYPTELQTTASNLSPIAPTKGQRQRSARLEFEALGGFGAWRDRFIQQECVKGSAIAPALAELNIRFIEEEGMGFRINLELNQQITRFPEGSLVTGEWNRNHNYLAAAFFTSESGQIFNAKVAYPREDFRKLGFSDTYVPTGKQRRYEAVTGGGNVIFYPALDRATRERINLQMHCEMPLEGPVWPWLLEHPEIPIGITEGAKKALALCSQGFLAVAVLGIANWSVPRTEQQKAADQARVLLPELGELAKGDRLIPIWYDQDDSKLNLKAFLNAKREGQLLTAALKTAGADSKTALMWWPAYMGKGVDDVIVALKKQGSGVVEWILETIFSSKNAAIYNQIQGLYTVSENRFIESSTQGGRLADHLNIKIQWGKIHAVIAGTGAGKTTVLKKLIKDWIASGGFALVMTPTNNLGKPLANDLGLPHRHEFDSMGLLQLKAEADSGFVCCVDSLPKLEKYIPADMPLLVVCEEADQVANHTTSGQTLKGKYAATQESFYRVLTQAKAILLAEARIPENTLRYFEQLSGKSTRVFVHKLETNKRSVTCYGGQISGYEALILQRLRAGERILLVSDSQRELEKLDRLVTQEIPNLKIVRNDRKTAYLPEVKELITTPNKVLANQQPQALLLSPSSKSGVSLDGQDEWGNAYVFDRVMAIFRVLPTSDQIQMIARYRPDCPWDIYLSETIQIAGDETSSSPRKLSRTMEEEAKAIAQGWGIPYDPQNRPSLERIARDHYVVATVRAGLEKRINRYSMVQRLQEDGHRVTEETLPYHKRMADRMKLISYEIDREWSDLIASMPLVLTDTIEVAKKLDQLEAPNPEQRAKAEKIRLVAQHPGLDFNDPELCYQATRHYKALVRGVDLEAAAQNIRAVADSQKKATIEHYEQSILAVHHLPHKAERAALMMDCGILELLGSGQTFTSLSPEVLELKRKMLARAKDWERYFSFHFSPEQTPISFLTRGAKRLGIEFHVSRPGSTEERPRQYQVYSLELIDRLIAEGMEKIEAVRSRYEDKTAQELDGIVEAKVRQERKRVQRRRGEFPTGIGEPDTLLMEVISEEALDPLVVLTAEHQRGIDRLLDLRAQVEARISLLDAALSRYLLAASALSIVENFPMESVDDGGDLEKELPLDLAPR